MADQRSPDHSDDPRDQDLGHGGYPEAQPGGATPDEAGDERERPAAGEEPAPSPSTDEEADRTRSTGNPHAAG